MVYTPASLVTVGYTTPVSTLVASTRTPGVDALDVSVTSPVIVARFSCAVETDTWKRTSTRVAMTRKTRTGDLRMLVIPIRRPHARSRRLTTTARAGT